MKITWVFLGFLGAVACSTLPARGPSSEDSFSSSPFENHEKMDIERLKSEAFSRCQSRFNTPVIEPIAILDPPKGGQAEGMTYQAELAVRTTNLLESDGFYFSPRPRAAVNRLPMEIFVGNDKTGIYQRKTWENANPDYSSSEIQPPISKSAVPPAGRVLTELVIGHRSPRGDYPQLFDLRSSAYVRFAGYPPQVTGASLRLGAHNIFGRGANGETNSKEDFPVIRAIFVSVKNPKTANALVLVESGLFCGALRLDMTAGHNAEILVDSYWYTRDDFNWKQDPNTALVAYSSMFLRGNKPTPEKTSNAAHDSDVLTVKSTNGIAKRYPLSPPSTGLQVRDLTVTGGQQPMEWTLANEERNPSCYAYFQPTLGNTNYNFRASYKVTILESSVKTSVSLFQQVHDGEYSDNIVAASTIRQDIKKADSVDQFVHFKYKTTAFFPDQP